MCEAGMTAGGTDGDTFHERRSAPQGLPLKPRFGSTGTRPVKSTS